MADVEIDDITFSDFLIVLEEMKEPDLKELGNLLEEKNIADAANDYRTSYPMPPSHNDDLDYREGREELEFKLRNLGMLRYALEIRDKLVVSGKGEVYLEGKEIK